MQVLINRVGAPLPIEVDFLSGEWEFKVKTLGKNQMIFKAIGLDKTPPQIVDATAGFGQDTFSFLSKGCKVTAIEENPYIYLLLKNGLELAVETKKWSHLAGKFTVINAEAIQYMKENKIKPDVIYLDPMYSEISDKAKSKKEMEFLKEFLKPRDNSQSLLDFALVSARERVIIKRPAQAPSLNPKPTHSFQGRSTRYDMYITSNLT